MRIFSDIKIRVGPDANGLYTIQRVPIMYGDPSAMVAWIIKGGSENTLMPSPMFSAWIENIKMNDARRQDSQFVGTISTVERQFIDGAYNNQPGIRYEINRYMPVPYDFTFKLDVWTTNTTSKLQIFEQIAMIFNKSVQIQQDSNLLDWTSIFEVWLEDFVWTNRTIPQGGEEQRDVMSFKFKIEGWINPPAKVKKSGLVAEIVARVYDSVDIDGIRDSIDKGEEYDPFSCLNANPIQIVTTEGNFSVEVEQGPDGVDTITLLNPYQTHLPPPRWFDLIQKYGQITPNITKIRLKLDPDLDVDDSDIIGTIEQDPDRVNVLFFTPDVDTLPANTMPAITTIIDPIEVWPGKGLPIAMPGQRYLLTSHQAVVEEPAIPPGVPTSPWGTTLVAYPNDIIEFNGVNWFVTFDSQNSVGKNYVVNSANSTQYVFEDGAWAYSYYGIYAPGYFRIDNIVQAPNGTTISVYE